jgi:AcrR family transcriptional regulator
MPAESSVKSESSGDPSAPRRPRRTQAERVAESDRKLLGAALKLIGERGYGGTSLAAIGEAAGYSRGLVHERFGSKAGLLWALVEQILRVWNREGRERGLAGLQGFDALAGMIDNHRRAVEQGRGIRACYALMFEALGPTPELVTEFRGLHRTFRADIERAIRQGVEAGTIRADVDPPAQAALLLGALRGLAFQALLDPDGVALAAAYEMQKQNLRRVLSP